MQGSFNNPNTCNLKKKVVKMKNQKKEVKAPKAKEAKNVVTVSELEEELLYEAVSPNLGLVGLKPSKIRAYTGLDLMSLNTKIEVELEKKEAQRLEQIEIEKEAQLLQEAKDLEEKKEQARKELSSHFANLEVKIKSEEVDYKDFKEVVDYYYKDNNDYTAPISKLVLLAVVDGLSIRQIHTLVTRRGFQTELRIGAFGGSGIKIEKVRDYVSLNLSEIWDCSKAIYDVLEERKPEKVEPKAEENQAG